MFPSLWTAPTLAAAFRSRWSVALAIFFAGYFVKPKLTWKFLQFPDLFNVEGRISALGQGTRDEAIILPLSVDGFLEAKNPDVLAASETVDEQLLTVISSSGNP